MDGGAVARWRFPAGMTRPGARVTAVEGGTLRISLTDESGSHRDESGTLRRDGIADRS